MIAPKLTFGVFHAENGHPLSPDDPVLKEGLQQHIEGATRFVSLASIDSGPKEGWHRNQHSEQGIKVSTNGKHGISIVEEPKSCCGEINIGLLQEPTKETGRGAQNTGMIRQPTKATDSVANVGSAAIEKRVQWNDNYGKELVHVFEYEVSDTGDSEQDDDDTHSCACIIQ